MKIISRNKVDFNSLLSAVYNTTEKRIADKADRIAGNLGDDERFARYLGELCDTSHDIPSVENHLHFSVLVLIEDYDLNTVMSAVNSLAWVGTSTTKRGVLIGLLSGTLPQWRNAVQSGLPSENSKFYTDLASLFKVEGFDLATPQQRKLN